LDSFAQYPPGYQPPPPPPFRPIPQGHKNPCPDDCACYYPRDYFKVETIKENHECIPCKPGEKVLLNVFYMARNEDCINKDCVSGIGKTYERIELWGERRQASIGLLLGFPGERPDMPECAKCPECPKDLECRHQHYIDCEINDPDVEEKPTGKIFCFCNELT
jgi:hypothetical protein